MTRDRRRHAMAVLARVAGLTVTGLAALALWVSRPTPAAAGFPAATAFVHDSAHHQLLASQVMVGVTVHPLVIVPSSDDIHAPTGTVDVDLRAGADCSGPVLRTSTGVPLVNGSAEVPGVAWTLLVTGRVCYTIDYSGDAFNPPESNVFVQYAVFKGEISAFSVAFHDRNHAGSLEWPLGTWLHPFIELAGQGATPAGSVDVDWFSGFCSTHILGTDSPVAVQAGIAHAASLEIRPSQTGTYAVRVAYLGDANYAAYDAGCQTVQIAEATPTLVTGVHDAAHATVTQVPIGTTVHPRIELTGPFGGITANVSVAFYPSSNCTGTPVVRAVSVQSGSSDGDVTDVRGAVANGSYRTTFGGNAQYKAVTGTCDRIEWRIPTATSAVVQNQFDLTVAAIVLPQRVHVAVTVSASGSVPTGTVKVRVYRGFGCTGGQMASLSTTLSSGAAASADLPLTSPGEYSTDVQYVGGTTYLSSLSPCRNVTVRATASATLTGVIAQGATATVPVGVDFAWRVIVTGDYKVPSGHAFVYEYPTADCSGQEHIYGTPIVGGAGTTLAHRLLDTTTISARAVYSSDNFYVSAETVCVQLAIVRAKPAVVGPVHDAGHQSVTGVTAGAAVHPALVASGSAGTPTGQVTFSFYTNGSCTGSPAADSGASAVSGGAADAPSFAKVLDVGEYSFRAHYLGDARYEPRDANCVQVRGLEPGDTPPPPTAAPPTATLGPTIAVTTPPPGTSYPPVDGLPSGAPSGAPSGPPVSTSPDASGVGGTSPSASRSGGTSPVESAGGPGSGTGTTADPAPAGSGTGVPPLALVAMAVLAVLVGAGAFLFARRSAGRPRA